MNFYKKITYGNKFDFISKRTTGRDIYGKKNKQLLTTANYSNSKKQHP